MGTSFIIKNHDKHDNRIENLELMSREVHTQYHVKLRGTTYVDIKCPFCGNVFTREARQTFLKKPGYLTTCCSRVCSAKLSNFHYSEKERLKIGLGSVINTYHV